MLRATALLHVLCLCNFLYATRSQATAPLISFKQSGDYCSTDNNLLQDFCEPIMFTRTGMTQFLEKTFNHPRYAIDFFPYSFSHCIQFLEFGKHSAQGKPFFESCLRLFLNKLKSVRFVTNSSLDELLSHLPDLLQEHTTNKSSLVHLVDTIKSFFYDAFLTKFSLFKNEPDKFFEELSTESIAIIQQHVLINEAVSREQLKQMLIRFLETGLLKVIWSPADQEEVWHSVKSIAQHLTVLNEREIITRDELDDLFKSLLESFHRFLDLAGTDLSDAMLDNIKKDINAHNLLLLTLEEQEQHLRTKQEQLIDQLCIIKARKIALDKGILLEPVQLQKSSTQKPIVAQIIS